MSSLNPPIAPADGAGPLSASAGRHVECPRDRQALPVLDDPAEWQVFSSPAQGEPGSWESKVVIEGMHCAACAFNVEQALLATPGVRAVEVDAIRARARVRWSADATRPSAWMGRLLDAGYHAVPAHDAGDAEHKRREQRQVLWRWLVAGLCMMQIMMYATPVYLAPAGDIGPEMERLLRWASWVLVLPVVLFSCRPFWAQAWRDLRHRRLGMDVPVTLGIAVTFVVSTAGTFEPDGPFGTEVYFDSLSMFVFILLSARWMEARLRERTAATLDAALHAVPEWAERVTASGAIERVSVRRLLVGDVVHIAAGDVIVADGTVLSGHTHVDQAMLNGEAQALARGPGDAVLAGSHNLNGSITLRVTALGADTRHAQIVALMEQAAVERPHVVHLADRVAPWFLWGVLVLAVLAAVLSWSRGAGHALMVAAAVLVVTCPCALSIATPASLLNAAGRLARSGIWVRRLAALETLARVRVLVFDKTGTLTEGTARVGVEAVRAGLHPAQALAWAASLAAGSHHPVAQSLVFEVNRSLASARSGESDIKNVASALSWRDVNEKTGQGIEAQATDGTGGCWRLGSAAFCGVTPQAEAALVAGAADVPGGQPGLDETAERRGLAPALASARSRVYLRDGSGLVAVFSLDEQIRADAALTVRRLLARGLQVQILSGDQPLPVARVAQALGIDRYRAGQSPDDKLRAIRDMRAGTGALAMVGDGLNDGPVLGGADVGLAMGHGVALARSRADVVLVGTGLAGVVDAIDMARRTVRIVRQNIAWAVAYNTACVPLAVLGYLPAWAAGLGMTASSLLVMGNALRLASPAAVQTDSTDEASSGPSLAASACAAPWPKAA